MLTLEQKIDKIYDLVHEQNAKLARHIERQDVHSELLAEHKKKIEELEAHKNKTYGFAAVISLILTAIGHFITKFLF